MSRWKNGQEISVTYQGITYGSVKEFYEKCAPKEIKYTSLLRRLQNGLSPEEALNTKPREKDFFILRNCARDFREHKVKDLTEYANSIGMEGYDFI